MNHAWKSINGLVGFTSSFDQLKIQFYTETKKKPKKSFLKTVNHYREGIYTSTCQRLPRWSSGCY